MVLLLLGSGIFGLLGVSVLCPLLASSAFYFLRRKPHEKSFPGADLMFTPWRIEIIIPAHNEAALIGATLTSIQQSIQYSHNHIHPDSLPETRVHVGADACGDDTVSLARQFSTVQVTEFAGKKGKWSVIKTLITDSCSDWVFLVDAGTLWPENFLSNVVHRIDGSGPNVMAVAPSYRPSHAGRLHQFFWRVEIALKRIESYCGGPISLHGATVGYKTNVLKKALELLGDTLWLNDDIVIPLSLRALYPKGVILYPVGEVEDVGAVGTTMDLDRRTRILKGNLQWVSELLPTCLRRNPVAGVLAGRRVFRMLWAYWLALLILGVALTFQYIVFPGLIAIGVLWASSGSFRQFGAAALVSLLAPWLILQTGHQPQGAWK